MPTPLETYIRGLAAVSYLKSAFAIGSDNAGSTLLRDGMMGYRYAMPLTLAGHCVGTGTAWSQSVNDAWVTTMVNDNLIKSVIIYHAHICAAIMLANKDGKVNPALFDANYLGNRNSPTFTEIKNIMNHGFINSERSSATEAILTRP